MAMSALADALLHGSMMDNQLNGYTYMPDGSLGDAGRCVENNSLTFVGAGEGTPDIRKKGLIDADELPVCMPNQCRLLNWLSR